MLYLRIFHFTKHKLTVMMTDNNDTIGGRLKRFISHKKLSVRQFERICDLSNGYVGRVIWSVGQDKLRVIKEKFPELNDVWLITGKGEMLADVENESTESASPFFDNATIEGGHGIGNGNEQFLSRMASAKVVLPNMPIGENIPYIQVHGRSMVNHKDPEHSIPDGAMIALQEANPPIHWGEVYAFMTNDGPVVKKIQPSEVDGCISCVSFNTEEGYFPYEQLVNDIVGGKMYYVVGVVSAKRWK